MIALASVQKSVLTRMLWHITTHSDTGGQPDSYPEGWVFYESDHDNSWLCQKGS